MLLVAFIAGCGKGEKQQLTVFTWEGYISEEIKTGFEKEFDARVVVDIFASNDDLLTKLQSGTSGYDIITPSDYMVDIMIKENLLAELNQENIPNFKNISPQFRGKYFDPENRYSVPYTWGTAGVAYDSAVLTEPPESWAILWDKQYERKFSMLDDQRETIGVALKLLGYSVNTTNLDELNAAKEKLLEQKPLVKQYKSEAEELLSPGDVAMAHCWSGDALRAAETRPTIKYTIPEEGTTQFVDTLCIPRTAKNKQLAEQFINYLLRPEINAKITEFTKYGTCVAEARNYVSPELRDHPGIYPSEEVMAKFESIIDLGDFTPNYDRIWTEVKAK
jgi:spermidine/putrescine transport system substrate-binding protein